MPIFGVGYWLKKDISSEVSLNNEQYIEYQTKTYLTNEIIDNAKKYEAILELERRFTPSYMLEVSDAVVIASVISVDNADTLNNPALGNTYGTMVINNVLYGNLEQGKVIKYFKSGGIMTLAEYEKGQLPDAVAKREELRKNNGIDATKIYINSLAEYDVHAEEGKVYLCYLNYVDRLKSYEIVGLGQGFREVNITRQKTVTSKSISLDNLQVLNNETGKYENLNEYIALELNVSK